MEHREIVKICMAYTEIEVILVGKAYKDFADEYGLNWFPNAAALRLEWEAQPPSNCFMLLKGSRGVALENVLF
jgi:UDP-N-acetylmuramoyl-tripeptide--D-alanyl-D-alanine ligase